MTDSYITKLRTEAETAIAAIKAADNDRDCPITVRQAHALPAYRDFLTLATPEAVLELLNRLWAAEIDRDGQAALADSLALRLEVIEHRIAEMEPQINHLEYCRSLVASERDRAERERGVAQARLTIANHESGQMQTERDAAIGLLVNGMIGYGGTTAAREAATREYVLERIAERVKAMEAGQ